MLIAGKRDSGTGGLESVRKMLNMQTQEQQKITIVGAVYETVTTNGDAFQRQIRQKQLEEKRAEQIQRTREVLETNQPNNSDVVDLSAAATERAQAADKAPAAAPEQKAAPAPEPAPAPARGQSLNTIA